MVFHVALKFVDMYFVVSTLEEYFIMSSSWALVKLCPGHIYTHEFALLIMSFRTTWHHSLLHTLCDFFTLSCFSSGPGEPMVQVQKTFEWLYMVVDFVVGGYCR